MGQLERVPCIQINSTNIDLCWSHLIKAIEQSHFVAIDLEFSGLGDKKKLILKDIEDRYQAISEVASTRSILSVGLSLFRYNRRLTGSSAEIPDEAELNEWNFKVTNFELLTLCKQESVLESESKSFLVSHGFDFDLQESSGLQYSSVDQNSDAPSIRNLFNRLVSKQVPLVFHNGLLDLVFIYHHFLASLPSKLTTFVADLDQLFPKGLFDTKYIAEHNFSPKGSYLEYLFFQRQRHNLERRVSNKSYVSIDFNSDDSVSDFIVYRSMKTIILGNKPDGLKICNDYRQHGWCKNGSECLRSHDIDFILDDENIYKNPNKSRKRILAKMNSLNSCNSDPDRIQADVPINASEHINGQVKSGIHRSGYDAFMTGYCLATFIIQLSRPKPGKSGKLNFSTSEIKKITNKIFLTGKKDPLQIRFSPYSKGTSSVAKIVSSTKDREENSPEDKSPLDEEGNEPANRPSEKSESLNYETVIESHGKDTPEIMTEIRKFLENVSQV